MPSRDHGARKEAGAAERLPRTSRFDVGKESTTASPLQLPARLSRTTREQFPDAATAPRAADVPFLLDDYIQAKQAEQRAKAAAEKLRDGLLPVVRQAYAKRWQDVGSRPKRPVYVRDSRVAFVVSEPTDCALSDTTAAALTEAGFGDLIGCRRTAVYDRELLHDREVVEYLSNEVAKGRLPERLLTLSLRPHFVKSAEHALENAADAGVDSLQRFLHAAASAVRQHFTV